MVIKILYSFAKRKESVCEVAYVHREIVIRERQIISRPDQCARLEANQDSKDPAASFPIDFA